MLIQLAVGLATAITVVIGITLSVEVIDNGKRKRIKRLEAKIDALKDGQYKLQEENKELKQQLFLPPSRREAKPPGKSNGIKSQTDTSSIMERRIALAALGLLLPP